MGNAFLMHKMNTRLEEYTINSQKVLATWICSKWHWICTSILILAVFLLSKYCITPSVIRGNSMYPTLKSGEFVLISRIKREPKHGDIVLLHTSLNGDKPKYIIKRVIAVGEETLIIDYDSNSIYVNGEHIIEPYVNMDDDDIMVTSGEEKRIKYHIPSQKIFVMGDNRNYSTDSRDLSIGFVSYNDIIGFLFSNMYETA